MGLFCKCEAKISEIQANYHALNAQIASLETSLASLRGVINAKLGGSTYTKSKNGKRRLLVDDDESDPLDDFSDEEREFINGLSVHEREGFLNKLRR